MRPRSKLIVGSLMLGVPALAFLAAMASTVGGLAVLKGLAFIAGATWWTVKAVWLICDGWPTTPTQSEDH